MIPSEDLLFSLYDKHAAGGQRAGMSGIGLRAEHLPTGTVVILMGSMSQHRLKAVATRMIEAGLTDPEWR